MSGAPGGPQAWPFGAGRVEGPAPALFLNALQGIAQALQGNQFAAQQVVTITIALSATAPAAPTSGWIIYADPVSGDLMAVSSLGNRRVLASP